VNVVVRLVLLAGGAAALSLMVREPLARAVAARMASPVIELAEVSRRIASRAAMLPLLPTASAPIVPMLPSSSPHVPIIPVPLHHKQAAKPASSSVTLTRKQIDDAVASRVGGARAALVRDDAGHAIGLRLSHVGPLAAYGIHEGDILTSANGLPLRTPDEALAALGKLQDARHVVVAFRRGATAYTIPVDLVD